MPSTRKTFRSFRSISSIISSQNKIPIPVCCRTADFYCSPEDSRRFDFKPGMAGLAWINGRNRLPWDERVRMDLCYVDHWSLALDFSILLKATVLLFRREGVYFPESQEQGAGRAEPEVGSQISEVGKSGELEVKSKESATVIGHRSPVHSAITR